jgi:molybdopterin-guanine dinucleotide biosynthesis protein B
MKAIEIVGKSKSGKTTLIEALIKELTERNLKVGAIKKSFHHNVEYDKEGKDTYKMEKAGASITGGFSKNSAFICYRYPLHPREFIKEFSEVNILLIEGEMGLAVPKVYCLGSDPAPDDPLIFAYFSLEEHKSGRNEKTFSLKDTGELCELILERVPDTLPQLNCGKCGYDCTGLLTRILGDEASIKDCKVLYGTKSRVKINGKPVELMPFLDEMFVNIVKGFLSPLKGYSKGKIHIDIEE